MPAASKYILALDVGEKRVGVALADGVVPFARALTTLNMSDKIAEEVNKLIQENEVATLVVGYPRRMDGSASPQTAWVEKFVESLKLNESVKLVWQDESLTSVKAEEELAKTNSNFTKAEVDALAATYILEDYLKESI